MYFLNPDHRNFRKLIQMCSNKQMYSNNETPKIIEIENYPGGRIRFGVGRSWISVELWVGQICDSTP